METCCPLPGRSRAWGGGALFAGFQGNETLEQLPKVMVGLPPSSPRGYSGKCLKPADFLAAGGWFHRGWWHACVGFFRPD